MLSSSRWLLTICFTLTCSSFLVAQETPSLPQNWKQLPAHEFSSAAIEPFKNESLFGNERTEVSLHAKELLLSLDLTKTARSDYPMLDELYELCRKHLTEEQIEAMRQVMLVRKDDWANQSYKDARSKIAFMEWLELPHDVICEEAKLWHDQGGDPAEIWDEDLPLLPYYLKRKSNPIKGNFRVVWEGRLIAPETGEFTFSISPINVNVSEGKFHLLQTIVLTIAGQEVLRADPDNWNSKSAPVSFQKNGEVDFKYEMTVDTTELPPQSLHAILKWEGPGIQETVIPQWQYRLAQAETQGLRATYYWTENGEERQLARAESEIDYTWSSGKVVLADEDTSTWSLWMKTTRASYLDSLVSGEKQGTVHPLLTNPRVTSEGLSSSQREGFLDELLARPRLLKPLNAITAANFYRAYRFGVPQKALNAWGLWATQNADIVSELPHEIEFPGYDHNNQEAYRDMAVALCYESPEELERLRTEFLELADGRCVLPVANTLSCAYLATGEFKAWIEFLGSKTNSDSLSGEQKVNWLIAKAFAEEVKNTRKSPRYFKRTQVLAGRHWLEEAMLSSDDPATQNRIKKELAARLASAAQYNAADELLNTIATSEPQVAAVWKSKIATLKSAQQEAAGKQQVQSQAAYLKKLKERKQRALDRGDDESVRKLNKRLQQLEAK